MLFILFCFISALFIEALASAMSIIGLSLLFSTDLIIILMAVALDVGKLVTVSFLYKNWKKMNFIMKTYMTIASAILMLITSAGAGGYLSAEFQGAIMSTKESDIKVSLLKEEQSKLEARKLVIDTQIAELPKNYVKSRAKLAKQFETEINQVNTRISEIDKELPALKIAKVSDDSHVGPILYIAEAFKVSVEDAVKYVILLIIFVFDPLAITLIIGGNFLLEQRRQEKLRITREKEKKDDDEIHHRHKLEIAELRHQHKVVDEVSQIENIYSHLGESTDEQKEETSETITERDSQVEDIIVEKGVENERSRDIPVEQVREVIEEAPEENPQKVDPIVSKENPIDNWTIETTDRNSSPYSEWTDNDDRLSEEIENVEENKEELDEPNPSVTTEEQLDDLIIKTPKEIDNFPEVWSLKDIQSSTDISEDWKPRKENTELFKIYRKDVVQ